MPSPRANSSSGSPSPFRDSPPPSWASPWTCPVRGLLISASPVAGDPGQPGGYEATIVFLMENADSARVYRPVLRLAWQGIARLLFGDAAGGALAASFTVDGDKYLASGVRMPGAAALGASTFGAWLKGFAQ